MKVVSLIVVVLAMCLTTGCASLFGTGAGGQQVWTYNLQQSLARSGGDVAMTMVLDQGVPKAEAVRVCNVLISLIGSNVSRADLEAQLNAQVAAIPLLKSLVEKLESAIPASIGGTDQIPQNIKDILLSFLKDGAVYGAGLYKDASKDLTAPAVMGIAPDAR